MWVCPTLIRGSTSTSCLSRSHITNLRRMRSCLLTLLLCSAGHFCKMWRRSSCPSPHLRHKSLLSASLGIRPMARDTLHGNDCVLIRIRFIGSDPFPLSSPNISLNSVLHTSLLCTCYSIFRHSVFYIFLV